VAWARQIEADIDAGRFQPGRLEAERTTLFEALDRYLAEIVPQKKGTKQAAGIVRAWQQTPLARKALAAIRSTDLASWRDAKLKQVGPQTVVHHLNILSHLYRIVAADWGLESLGNPVTKIKKPSLPKGRERRLRSDEEQRLLEVCDQSQSYWLEAAVGLALATAMREGELERR
jgi:integrase